jgi:tetratricopeptide (TPR) repeat protein
MGMAISKYLFVADTFAARGDMNQARGLYEQVLDVAPMDLGVREKLITLLQGHGMVEEALEHHLALADAHYELAQIEASRDRYRDALRLASRLPDSKQWTARILHRMGDIDLQRLDWRSAIEVFLQLKTAVPDDLKARQRLVELYLNLQRQTQALKDLDELVKLYRRQNRLSEAVMILNDLASAHPDVMELRKRAAQVCVEAGDRAGAIAHLDAMGELQLEAGRVQEAVATIRAIIALGPENVEAYRQLLEQIA